MMMRGRKDLPPPTCQAVKYKQKKMQSRNEHNNAKKCRGRCGGRQNGDQKRWHATGGQSERKIDRATGVQSAAHWLDSMVTVMKMKMTMSRSTMIRFFCRAGSLEP